MRRVQQHLPAVRQGDELEARRPLSGLETLHDRRIRHVETGAARRLEQANRHDRVVYLVLAAQREPQRAVTPFRCVDRQVRASLAHLAVDAHPGG